MKNLLILKKNIVKTDKEIDPLHSINASVNTSAVNNTRELDSVVLAMANVRYLMSKKDILRNDTSVNSLLSNEGLDIFKTIKTSINAVKAASEKIKSFFTMLGASVNGNMVPEQFIRNRFAKLKQTLSSFTDSRVLVKDVMTYQEATVRIVGLLNCAEYIKLLSKKENLSVDDINNMCRQLIKKSNGVFNTEFTTDLVYKEAKTQDIIITKQSDWANTSKQAQLELLLMKCKYDACEDIEEAAKILSKRYDELLKDMQQDDSAYSNDYNDYDEDAANADIVRHTSAYLIGKYTKQIYAQGLLKEVNAIVISTIYRLCNYKQL